MGLGKTFCTIAFIDSFLHFPANADKKIFILIVVPVTVVRNWIKEFSKWLPKDRIPKIHAPNTITKHKTACMNSWVSEGGVCIIGYETYAKYAKVTPYQPKQIQDEQEKICHALISADVVIVDEAHKIKNPRSNISKALKQVRTRRKLCLTGYPLQNNLQEYWCMVDFIKPNYLGSLEEFNNMFANPIANGRHKDSTPADVALSKKRSCIQT
jgi:SNF2 family DNA or RNA helicase